MLKELEQYANHFLLTTYNMPLAIPIVRNNRLRTSLGRFLYNRKGEAVQIELAGFLLDQGVLPVIHDVLKHECIHYALFMQGLPHQDGSSVFEKELQRYSVSRTHTLKVGSVTEYMCMSCHKKGETKNNRLIKSPHLYRTVCCNGKLKIMGEKMYDGREI